MTHLHRGFVRYLYLFPLLLTAASAPAFQPRFDVSTSPQDNGYRTEGLLQLDFSPTWGVRGRFLKELDATSDVADGADLSTVAQRVDRLEASLTAARLFSRDSIIDSLYFGAALVNIGDNQNATWVVTDDTDVEYGTQYANRRVGTFVSPLLAGRFAAELMDRPLIRGDYTVNLSPVFLFSMTQTVAFDNVGLDTDRYEHDVTKAGGPHLDHRLRVQVGRFIRVTAEHSFYALPYEALQLADDGLSMAPVADPSRTHEAGIGALLTVPLIGDLSFDVGVAYRWTRTTRTADWVAEANRVSTDGGPVYRIGASLWGM